MLEQASYTQWIGATLDNYRLEQLLASSALGPLFLAHDGASRSPVLIRVMAVPPAQSLEATATYERYVERQASHIAAMRHPYILPLVRYGLEEGVPYLVWAQVAARSLTMRLAQSGPLDVVTMGRYLDQLASALEYAHERATVHRNLSTDCVYLQLDGQLAVGDFGVRRLFELLSPGDPNSRFLGSVEACAPEQLRGERVDTYSDVYALGAVTYRMLTGQAPFAGETPAALAEQHLHAPPPPLRLWRAGMPAALDAVLATALAKDPAQRYQHPGELANAYHEVVAPNNATRVPFTVGHPARDVAPTQPSIPRSYDGSRNGRNGQVPLAAGAPRTATSTDPAAVPPVVRLTAGRLVVVGVLLLALASGGLFLLTGGHLGAPASGATGSIDFFDAAGGPTGDTNGVRLDVKGLSVAPSGSHYAAWLINQQREQILALGSLTPASGNTFTLQYQDSDQADSNLLSLGNEIEVTEEHGDVQAPVGQVLLVAAFPPEAFVHIKHLLVAFPTTPGQIGLLVGLLLQTRALSAQATALHAASATGDTPAVNCRTQNIIDILEGSHGGHYQPLDAACAPLGITPAADGFGLLESANAQATNGIYSPTGYFASAVDHASLAATTPDATQVIRSHARQVEAAIAGMQDVAAVADSAAVKLLASPGDTATATDVVAECAQIYGTGGANGAGAENARTAYAQGQLMASLTLSPQS